MIDEKRKILKEIRNLLSDWERTVDCIGNECAYTDRFLDDLPELVDKLREIK